ncbi:MAG: DUF604 domain-containing protein, partial [Candidatus Regiella insecticola]|nr:DUF604 domain-containing protein [Candidatus Regiella insecticola]
RYHKFYGSDQKIQGCLSEIGVPLTKEVGFHQVIIIIIIIIIIIFSLLFYQLFLFFIFFHGFCIF